LSILLLIVVIHDPVVALRVVPVNLFRPIIRYLTGSLACLFNKMFDREFEMKSECHEVKFKFCPPFRLSDKPIKKNE